MNAKNSRNEDNEQEAEVVDVRKINVPAVMIFGVIGFFIWVTWIANTERNDFSNRLLAIENKLGVIDEKIKELHEEGSTQSLITKYDFRLWCLESQLVNAGWKCPVVQNFQLPEVMNRMNDQDIIREIEKMKPPQSNKPNQ